MMEGFLPTDFGLTRTPQYFSFYGWWFQPFSYFGLTMIGASVIWLHVFFWMFFMGLVGTCRISGTYGNGLFLWGHTFKKKTGLQPVFFSLKGGVCHVCRFRHIAL